MDATYTTPVSSGGTFIFANGAPARVFDGVTGFGTSSPQMTRFVPNNFYFNIQKNTTQGIGGELSLSLGSDANVIASYGGAGGTYTDVTQAFLYYATGPFTLDVGKYVTLAGNEVIITPSDAQISRSILFGYAIPFTHTGARLVYAPSSKISLTGGINYGWDQILSTNNNKTLEAAVAWTPSSAFSFNAVVYSGKEPSPLTPFPPSSATIYGTRTLGDFVVHWTPTTVWNFGLNYDAAKQSNAQSFTSSGAVVTNAAGLPILGTDSWNGLAGYANFNLNPHVTLSGRLETFNDNNGARTGYAQRWNEGTLTLQFNPTAANWHLRGEYRSDWSSQSVFQRNTTPFGSTSKNNGSLGLEVFYTWP